MKTIEDVVIRFNGLWQECFDVGFSPLGVTRQEFESAARKMGYINGYRWGVEYPTNGERPDLADDVLVEARLPSGNLYDEDGEDDVSNLYWCSSGSFCITDTRYKPADTGYLNCQPEGYLTLAHRKKVIDASFECLKRAGFDHDPSNVDYFDALYNAGMLVLPQKSGDTKG